LTRAAAWLDDGEDRVGDLTTDVAGIGSYLSSRRLAIPDYQRSYSKPARRAFNQRFLDQVDPDHRLPDRERHRRAESARRAYFTRLAYLSARSRRSRTRA
jgi:hypothetical protein